jgi:hypothetical protein
MLTENQALQRELNHDLIRCFSSTYLDDLRREENRHFQTRLHPRSFTYEDVQDIHMPPILEAYRMKAAVDRERRVRLTHSFEGHMTSSTPTSSLGAGQFSPLLSLSSPVMTGSLTENMDAQSGGFEMDRRSQKSHPSVGIYLFTFVLSSDPLGKLLLVSPFSNEHCLKLCIDLEFLFEQWINHCFHHLIC